MLAKCERHFLQKESCIVAAFCRINQRRKCLVLLLSPRFLGTKCVTKTQATSVYIGRVQLPRDYMSSVSLFRKWKFPVAVAPKPAIKSRVRKQNKCPSFGKTSMIVDCSQFPVNSTGRHFGLLMPAKLGRAQKCPWVVAVGLIAWGWGGGKSIFFGQPCTQSRHSHSRALCTLPSFARIKGPRHNLTEK